MQTLDIVTCCFNPIGWASRARLARAAIAHWLTEPNVRVTLVECCIGGREPELADLEANPRINYVQVRSTSLIWNKENLLNIGISRAPRDARYFGTFDADVHFRRPGWAKRIIDALHIHPVVQPWRSAIDLGPTEQVIQVHRSYASLHFEGQPTHATGDKFWKFSGGIYEYAHPGFIWAWVRDVLDRIGGLFELGGMGSADHHMAHALLGKVELSVPGGTHPNYLAALKAWEAGALAAINKNIGFVNETIEHHFHGSKASRAYVGRWKMFVDHQFDPLTHIKRGIDGVIDFAGNDPELRRKWHNYLIARQEDGNLI